MSGAAGQIQEISSSSSCRFMGQVQGYVDWTGPAGERDAKIKALNDAAKLGANAVVWTQVGSGAFDSQAAGQAYFCGEPATVARVAEIPSTIVVSTSAVASLAARPAKSSDKFACQKAGNGPWRSCELELNGTGCPSSSCFERETAFCFLVEAPAGSFQNSTSMRYSVCTPTLAECTSWNEDRKNTIVHTVSPCVEARTDEYVPMSASAPQAPNTDPVGWCFQRIASDPGSIECAASYGVCVQTRIDFISNNQYSKTTECTKDSR